MKIMNPLNNSKQPNFGSIKSIKFNGEFKNPAVKETLLKGLKDNKTIKQFNKLFETDIVFNAYKDSHSSSLNATCEIFYRTQEENKNLIDKIKGIFSPKKSVNISAGDSNTYMEGLVADDLIKKISQKEPLFQKLIKERLEDFNYKSSILIKELIEASK